VPAHHTALLSNEEGADGVVITSAGGARFVMIGGEMIREKVVQHGPFVMNTREEIMEAMSDYRSGRNGFERAPRFRSSIASGI
jgi:redox-sensitive bicupin YhaK (pirin superfamily)